MGNLGNKLIRIGQYCDCLQPIVNQIESEPQIQVKDLSQIQIQASSINHNFQKQLELQHRKQKAKEKKRKYLSKQQIQNKLIISQKLNNEKTQDSLFMEQINFQFPQNQNLISVKKNNEQKLKSKDINNRIIFQEQSKTQTHSQNLNQFLKSESSIAAVPLEVKIENKKEKQISPQNFQEDQLILNNNKRKMKDSNFNQRRVKNRIVNQRQIKDISMNQRKKIDHEIINEKKIKFSILEELNNQSKSNKKKNKTKNNIQIDSQEQVQKNHHLQLQQVIDLSKIQNKNHYKNKINKQQEDISQCQLNIQNKNFKHQEISDSFSLKDYFLDEIDKQQFQIKHQKNQLFN